MISMANIQVSCRTQTHFLVTKGLIGSAGFRQSMNQLQTSDQQISETNNFFSKLAEHDQRLSYIKKGEFSL